MKFSLIPLVIAIASTLLTASPVGINPPTDLVTAPMGDAVSSQSPAFAVGLPLNVVTNHTLELFGAGPTEEGSGSRYSISSPAKLQKRWNTICETTSGSPTSWHVEVAINFLIDKGEQSCAQSINHPYPSCSPLLTWGTGGIEICGEYLYRMRCDSAGDFARAIFDNCRNVIGGEDKVGGITLIRGQKGSGDYRAIQVYHA